MADTENSKSRVLIIGGTGHLGQRFVRASLACSHPTYVLFRPQAAHNLGKVDLLISFKKAGAHLVQGSLDDHESLVTALKQVDVVVSALAGTIVRNGILQQLKLLEAIEAAGNIKRFLPSEFGVDPDRLVDSIEPEHPVMIDKRKFGQGFIPSTERVTLYGDAKTKVIWVDEDDIASYTIRAIDDPRTEIRKVHIRPPANILSQGEVVEIWEKIIGHPLDKTQISKEDWLKTMEGKPFEVQAIISHAYDIFYEGCTTNFEIGADEKEACQLYHDVKYTSVESYLKLYV
ncbi:hypothetical protein SUGI_0563910 [Cryptomeria japonica]|nr:hypothetical protein SUGI_0563910 [Cryptomeria japonica]